MPAQLIDGKSIAEDVRNQVKSDVENRINNGQRAPGLAVILVGVDPASQVYVRKKREACAEAGILSKSHDLDENTDQQHWVIKRDVEILFEEDCFKIFG